MYIALAKCIQRGAVGTSKDEIVNVSADEYCNTPHAALKSYKGTPLALSTNRGMPSTSSAGHAIERATD
jgi:hypothetical protein